MYNSVISHTLKYISDGKAMFVYLFNILSICLYAVYFCRGEKTKLKRNFFLILCLIQCLMIACIRRGIGTDYGWYSHGFTTMAKSGFSDMKYEDWEIGFIVLNKIVGLFTKNVAVFIGICAAISLSGVFYLIWRYSKNPFMSVFLFLNTYLFYLNLNFVRQAIAMSLLCFAYGFFKDRKFWRFLLLCVLAATFHLPVIYLVPVYFFTYLKINLKTLPIYAGVLIVYFAASDAVLKVVLQHVHTEYADSRFIVNGVFWYYSIFPLIICVALVALAFYLKFELSSEFNILMHLTLIMGFWQIVMMKHALFERFSYYTMPFLIIVIPEALVAFKDKFSERNRERLSKQYGDDTEGLLFAEGKLEKKAGLIITLISAGVLILAFAYNMMGLILPEHGVHGVLPFRALPGIGFPNIDSWFKG